MTEEQINYLADLDALEGVGAHKNDVQTSKYYGITNAGLNMISNTIKRKDTNGNYTENAQKTRALLSSALLKVLDESIVIGKDKKGNAYLKDWAKVNQIAKFGKEGMAQLALAIRDINLRKIPGREGEPLREDTVNSILLTAHNRPSVLVGKNFVEAMRCGTERDISHVFLQDLEGVLPQYINGIKKRQAACWNSFRSEIPPREAIKLIDKSLITNKNHVNEIYTEEADRYGKKQLREFNNQAIDSQISNNDIGRLISDEETQTEQPVAAPKPPQEKSFLQRLGEIGMATINPMYGMVKAAAENQVAQEYENILKENEGEQ